MTTANTPSPQRRLAGSPCSCSDDDNCSPCSPASPCSTSSSTCAAGIRFRTSLPALLAKLLSLLALAAFLSAAVHDSAKRGNSSSGMSLRALAIPRALAGAQRPFSPPWFCHDRPCPPFAVLASPSPDSYAVRKYRAKQTWVSVKSINVSTYEAAYAAGGLALAAYVRGDNAESRKLTPLAGVPTLVSFSTNGDFSAAEDRYDVSMFLAPELGPDGKSAIPPPQPSSAEVTIEIQERTRTAYVVQFGGFATGRASLANAARVALALERDGLPYVSGKMELAIYDPPTRFAQRHNEVWLLEPEGGAEEQGEDDEVGKERRKKKKKKEKSRKDVGGATAFAA